jgi:hypothetical protein
MRYYGGMRYVKRLSIVRELGLIKQVEYLVVNYAAWNPRVTLSLRQADILMALAEDERLCKEGGCVPDLQKVSNTK